MSKGAVRPFTVRFFRVHGHSISLRSREKKLNITQFCSVLLDSARFVSFLFAGWARKNPQPAEKNSMALDFARFRSTPLAPLVLGTR